jgi:arylsulfatase A-like enzyme/acetyl esterase/lipase
MDWKKTLWGGVLGLGVCMHSLAGPNVIYILCDDLGYGEVGYNGQQKIQTPELDALSAKGMRFAAHYCGSSVCAPSRCALMTGKHPGHNYIRANSPGYPNGQTPIPADSETLGKLMQRAGYTTACIGKWGLGGEKPDGTLNYGFPTQQGFDYFFGYCDQRKAHNYYPDFLWRNEQKVQLGGKAYSHDLMTEEALKFVSDNASTDSAQVKPFFLYLAYTIPHTNYQVPDLGVYADKDWPEKFKKHAAMTSRMDRDVGRLMDLLEVLGIEKNTLVFFSSDNGAHGEQGSEAFFNTSGELRGIKRSMYEGGVRTPTFAVWPGTIQAGQVSDHVSAFWDMLPTFSELTGEPFQGETDGISMLPTLLGKTRQQKNHDYLYWELYERQPNQAVRMGNWKGVVVDRRDGQKIELYDLSKDVSEQTDLADKYPEVVEQIRNIMNEAHEPSPLWDTSFPGKMFNVDAACKVSGVQHSNNASTSEADSATPLAPLEISKDWKWISEEGSVSHSSLSKQWGVPHNHTLLTTMEGIQSFHTDAEKEPWVIIDLKDEQPVIGLEILNRSDAQWNRIENLNVWVSSDGTNWERVFKSANAERRWFVDLQQPKHARYVKIGTVNAKPQFFHLKGVKVYAKEGATATSDKGEAVPDKKVVYKTAGDAELKLHIFNPEGLSASDKRPAIVFFFGGGWTRGSPSQFYRHCDYLASRGMVAIAAEYRVKSRDKTTPRECVKDGKSAIRWVRENADELGIDPSRIAAGGGSAGGHVAAAVATVDGFEEESDPLKISCRPDALVLFNPVFDNGPGGWGHGTVKAYWEEISPMHNISKTTPPTVVFLGTKDNLIPVATVEEYQSRTVPWAVSGGVDISGELTV